MKNNYPIKYAAIPIEIYNRNNSEILCYIVSKVYLVSEEKRFDRSGRDETVFRIVPPYEIDDFNTYKRVEPTKNWDGDIASSISSIKVERVFNTKEEALKEKDRLNSIIIFNKKLYCPFDKVQRALLEESFNNTVSYYNQLEDLIMANTPDLVVNAPRTIGHTIIRKDDIYKETEMSIYDVIRSLKDFNYKAYSLTKREYNALLKALENKQDTSKYDKNLLLINNGKEKVSKVMEDDKWFYLNRGVASKGNYDSLSFNLEDCDISYYTTETYNEILKSYPNIENNTFKLERKK